MTSLCALEMGCPHRESGGGEVQGAGARRDGGPAAWEAGGTSLVSGVWAGAETRGGLVSPGSCQLLAPGLACTRWAPAGTVQAKTATQ